MPFALYHNKKNRMVNYSVTDHPPLSTAKVKEKGEVYICSTSEPLWPVLG